MSKLTASERERASKAHDGLTKKFADAQRKAGVRVDTDACKRRAAKIVKRAEDKYGRKR